MMSATEMDKKPKKAPTPEALEKKRLKEQKASLQEQIKQIDEKIVSLIPKKRAKGKVVMTANMTFARNVGNYLKQVRKTKDGKTVPKLVASKMNLRKACNAITNLNDVEKELERYQVENVAKEALALMEEMPKPERKAKVKSEAKPEGIKQEQHKKV